jgi:hypothetical protein
LAAALRENLRLTGKRFMAAFGSSRTMKRILILNAAPLHSSPRSSSTTGASPARAPGTALPTRGADATGRKFDLPLAWDREAARKSLQAMQDFFKKIFRPEAQQ